MNSIQGTKTISYKEKTSQIGMAKRPVTMSRLLHSLCCRVCAVDRVFSCMQQVRCLSPGRDIPESVK